MKITNIFIALATFTTASAKNLTTTTPKLEIPVSNVNNSTSCNNPHYLNITLLNETEKNELTLNYKGEINHNKPFTDIDPNLLKEHDIYGRNAMTQAVYKE